MIVHTFSESYLFILVVMMLVDELGQWQGILAMGVNKEATICNFSKNNIC
jgi:hypothetical protein